MISEYLNSWKDTHPTIDQNGLRRLRFQNTVSDKDAWLEFVAPFVSTPGVGPWGVVIWTADGTLWLLDTEDTCPPRKDMGNWRVTALLKK